MEQAYRDGVAAYDALSMSEKADLQSRSASNGYAKGWQAALARSAPRAEPAVAGKCNAPGCSVCAAGLPHTTFSYPMKGEPVAVSEVAAGNAGLSEPVAWVLLGSSGHVYSRPYVEKADADSECKALNETARRCGAIGPDFRVVPLGIIGTTPVEPCAWGVLVDGRIGAARASHDEATLVAGNMASALGLKVAPPVVPLYTLPAVAVAGDGRERVAREAYEFGWAHGHNYAVSVAPDSSRPMTEAEVSALREKAIADALK